MDSKCDSENHYIENIFLNSTERQINNDEKLSIYTLDVLNLVNLIGNSRNVTRDIHINNDRIVLDTLYKYILEICR